MARKSRAPQPPLPARPGHRAPVRACGVFVDVPWTLRGYPMSWTDERIETLRRMWTEGLSASQIATALGGVSRNAVIGKIHRLGLSGRVKTAKPRAARTARGGSAEAVPTHATATNAGGGAQPRAMAAGAAAVKVVEREAPAPARKAEVVSLHQGVTLLDLKPSSCRWPIGDPADEEFRFCGNKVSPGETYCACHAERAFPARGKPRK